jgi:hypothetical protein
LDERRERVGIVFSENMLQLAEDETMMTYRFAATAIMAMVVGIGVAPGYAQTRAAPSAAASTVGTGAASATPSSNSGVVGSGGSAAAGDTSASSLGLGGRSATPSQSSSSLGTGGSAAAPDGHVTSHSGVHGNQNALSGQSMDQAHDPGGVWSKSHTQTHVRQGDLTSRTKSMAHQPGGPPVKSTTDSSVDLGR